MHTPRARRAFFATALPGFTRLLMLMGCLMLTGCTTGDSGTRPDGGGVKITASGIQGQVTRGPLSPVAQPGQANTAPLPGVVITILNSNGTEAGRNVTDSLGHYAIGVVAGTYQVLGLAPGGVQGFPAPPAAQSVTVPTGQTVTVNLAYDTGIR